MIAADIQNLLSKTGLSQDQLVNLFDLPRARQKTIKRALTRLDAHIENSIIAEVDAFVSGEGRDIILIRFLSENDFALYETDLFEHFKCCSVHKQFIARTKRAIERIGGEVTITYMESNFYETWLGVNDLDDSRDIRIAWARQQIGNLNL